MRTDLSRLEAYEAGATLPTLNLAGLLYIFALALTIKSEECEN